MDGMDAGVAEMRWDGRVKEERVLDSLENLPRARDATARVWTGT